MTMAKEEATCATAIQHGFTSVMMDGSLRPTPNPRRIMTTISDITRRVSRGHTGIGLASGRRQIGGVSARSNKGGVAAATAEATASKVKVHQDHWLTASPARRLIFVLRATKSTHWRIAMGTSHGLINFPATGRRHPRDEVV